MIEIFLYFNGFRRLTLFGIIFAIKTYQYFSIDSFYGPIINYKKEVVTWIKQS